MRVASAVMLLGLLAAMIGGGSPSNLLRLRARRLWLLAVFVAGSVAVRFDAPGAFPMVLIATAAFAAFCFANALPIRGLMVVGFGLTLNFVVTANNHGMPYRPSAVVEAGAFSSRSADLVPRTTAAAHPEREGDQLMPLADVIALAPLREVVSVGDLLIAFGLGLVVFHGTLGDGLRRPRHNLQAAVLPSPDGGSGPGQPPETFTADPRVTLLRATGDASVAVDLGRLPTVDDDETVDNTDAGDPNVAETIESLTARLAVARALRGAPIPDFDASKGAPA